MKAGHKAILIIIAVIGLNEFGSKLYSKFINRKVKPGQVWVCTMPVMVFKDNVLVDERRERSERKVIKVEDGIVTYVRVDDTTQYTMDIDEFTFNGAGMTNSCY